MGLVIRMFLFEHNGYFLEGEIFFNYLGICCRTVSLFRLFFFFFFFFVHVLNGLTDISLLYSAKTFQGHQKCGIKNNCRRYQDMRTAMCPSI